MAKRAVFEPNATVVIGDQVFQFDDSGHRNVSEAEAELLAHNRDANGAPAVQIEEVKSKGKG